MQYNHENHKKHYHLKQLLTSLYTNQYFGLLDNHDNHENQLLQHLKNPASPYIEPGLRTRLRTVICRNSGTSRLKDEFILSNLEWPHKPHKPAGLWGHAYGVLGMLDLCILWSGMIYVIRTQDVLTHHSPLQC